MGWVRQNWAYLGTGISAVLTVARGALDAADALQWANVLASEWWTVGGIALVFIFGAGIVWGLRRAVIIQPPEVRSIDDKRYSQDDVMFWLQQALPLVKVGEFVIDREHARIRGTPASLSAPGQGAITLAGGNTTETTTTSTVPVDLNAVAGLDIGSATPCLVIARFRRTSGVIRVGLKLNATLVAPDSRIDIPDDAGEIDVVWYVGAGTSDNRRTVYLNAPRLRVSEYIVGERPRQRITSATVRGAVASPDATVAVEYMTVFELPGPMK